MTYDNTEIISEGLEKETLQTTLVDRGIFDAKDVRGINHPAMIGLMLLKCETLARGRGQTFVVWCGMFGWTAEVWGPAQGKRAIEIRTPEPWIVLLSAGQVAARVLIYLSEPLPEVTHGTVRVHSSVKCSECREPIDRQSSAVAESRGWDNPIECSHCGALLSAEKPKPIGMPYMESPI